MWEPWRGLGNIVVISGCAFDPYVDHVSRYLTHGLPGPRFMGMGVKTHVKCLDVKVKYLKLRYWCTLIIYITLIQCISACINVV